MTKDMTTGTPWKLLTVFAIPLLIGNVFQMLYSMVDMLIVGKAISREALAAIGATGGLGFLVFWFFSGITSGCTIITAQRFGAKDYDGVRRSVATSVFICFTLIVVVTSICLFTLRPVLEFIKTPHDIIEDAYLYKSVIFLGLFTIVFYSLLSGIIRALGDSRTPLYFLIIACVVNVTLDLVLIIVFGMGVDGAAWATNISQYLSGALCLLYMMRRYPILRMKLHDWVPDRKFIWKHLKVAVPMGFQSMIISIGIIILQSVLNEFGSVAVASYSASLRIEQLVLLPFFSFGMALATYVAQNYGAGKMGRIRKGVKTCMQMSVCIALVSSMGLLFFGKDMLHLFFDSQAVTEELLDYGQTYFDFTAPFLVILALLMIYRNALHGMGYAFITFLGGIVELIFRSAVVLILTNYLGYIGVCLSNPSAWIGCIILLASVYYYVVNRPPQRRKQPTVTQNDRVEET